MTVYRLTTLLLQLLQKDSILAFLFAINEKLTYHIVRNMKPEPGEVVVHLNHDIKKVKLLSLTYMQVQKRSYSYGVIVFIIQFLIAGCAEDEATGWQNLKDMPTARYGFGIVELNGLLYAAGGYNANGVKTLEVYKPESNTWQTLTSMPTGRGFLVVAKANDKIYAIGGITGGDLNNITYVYANEEYDPVTNEWTSKSPIPLKAQAPNSVFGNQFITGTSINNKIYITGGNAGDGVPTFVYDPSTDTWSSEGAPFSFFNNEPYASTSANNAFFVMQGSAFQKYNPVDDEWRVLQPQIEQRYGVGRASSQEAIYSIGGYRNGDSDDVSRKVEVYDFTKDHWTRFTSLNQGRLFAGVSMLNGRLYVVGGSQRSNYLNIPISSVEVFDLN